MRTKAAKQFRLAAEKLRCIQAPTKPQFKAEGNPTSPKSTPSELTSTVKSFQHQSNVSWDQIAGLDNTVRAIQSAYALNLARAPEGVSLRSNRNILFYGPPGCGKSLLAAAASHGLDAVFFNVPVSGLVSKWFGESAKLVSALYQEARQHPSSIVFLDEIDALAGDREAQDSSASRQILANLLAELDGVATKDQDDRVITIAATNSPWDLDPAILSRFSRRIYIPLPDHAARVRMLEILIQERGFELEMPIENLAKQTDGYSGREIEQICLAMIESMLWRKNPTLEQLVQQGRQALSEYTIKLDVIIADDFSLAMQGRSPQTPTHVLSKFERWA